MNYPEKTNGHSSEEGLTLSRAATLNGFEEAAPERVEVDKASQGGADQTQITPNPVPENPKEKPTQRLQWGKPLNKLALVLGGGAVVILVIYLFLEVLTKPSSKPAPTAELQDFPAPVEEKENNQEGRMRAEVALGDQAEAQENLAEKNAERPTTSSEATKAKAPRYNTVRTGRTTPPQRVAVPPTPRTSYAPSRTYTPTRSYSPSRPTTAPTRSFSSPPSRSRRSPGSLQPAKTTVEQDPVEAWLVASQLGSYGGFSPEVKGNTPESEVSDQEPSTLAEPSQADPDGIQEEPLTQVDRNRSRSPAFRVTSTPPETTPAAATTPLVNPQEEAAILTGQPQKMVVAGTKAAGILLTPMVWDEEGPQQQLVVSLSEPLRSADRQVLLKEGTQVLTQVLSLSEEGLVRMVAVAALVEQGGQQVEVPLPQNALLIHGRSGGALKAKTLDKKGPQFVRRDVMSFALGAVAKASELFTRPQESVSIFNAAGGSIAQTNPEPNILAGVLQGGSEALSEKLEERNDRAIDAIANRPNVPFLPAGTPIEVYANQTVALSSDFNDSPIVRDPETTSWLEGMTFGVATDTLPIFEMEETP